ncbi:transcriptional regulator NrdR [Desulfuribacillus alkaliarsenatis]|uniref:Transcriptional repressor NrdR n=1 Tax=Desulfuribacillus alkaliarsenatis TaxID=766136 RepID=A0A1E5FYF8_9FIRM|nr:transcriptional regulator NrdR [Desulfuribacillus alkaliarsenatis]OEF95605.1 transcriptional regulator NrdR [Desulfuribacillus alkaliarsenatis]
MRCPFCESMRTRVLDSRPINDGRQIRRRRECEQCTKRFTSFEIIEQKPIIVVKKDGSREEFNRQKLIRGLMRAGVKRNVPIETWEEVVDTIEREFQNDVRSEFPSAEVGDRVLEKIKHIDEVAYIRFASVYKEFENTSAFLDELKQLLK